MINAIASEFFGSDGPIVNPQWQASQPVIDESAAKRIATALGWEPKRTWDELTLAEVKEAYAQHAKHQIEDMGASGWVEFADALQTILRSKNT
jgi:hypothetical protein